MLHGIFVVAVDHQVTAAERLNELYKREDPSLVPQVEAETTAADAALKRWLAELEELTGRQARNP